MLLKSVKAVGDMTRIDPCGCVIERKYASDYLVRRLYNDTRGKEICDVKVDGTRWFKLYRKDGIITYKSTECPVLVISLEALCEAYEDNKGYITTEKALEKLRSVKGFQVTDLVKRIAEEFVGCIRDG